MNKERSRVERFGKLEDGLLAASDWYHWGPYLSERQWGTVREDYSADGEAWDYFPHDAARSRTYRFGEDGMAGFSDIEQRFCLSLALWNGKDPILKERMFGLTGSQGNHGEDVKEYWWYLDALPSHALNRWRYHYPQGRFPYEDLIEENGRRGKHDPEYELLDTGIFDEDRFWDVEVTYAKADPGDILMRIVATNAGPDEETLHVLPTAWFRNTWSWDDDGDHPSMCDGGDGRIEVAHPIFGDLELIASEGSHGPPTALFCDNETNRARLFADADSPAFPKDGINDHVVSGAPSVNPAKTGTKASFWYQETVAPGESVEIRLRLRPQGSTPARPAAALAKSFDKVLDQRTDEADEFYAELTPEDASADEALVMRQAFAGMLWSKQLYYYDVSRWLSGDPAEPTPPPERLSGRNSRWQNFDAFDIMSMPDKWEYPWFAAWDLAFHCVALAHVDPAFAKYQLVLICREWLQHPNGALPAYEWSFDDVNPPVQAWAALEVFAIDGECDVAFLRRVFDKLLVNFTWWVNREDADGSNLFEGGFLGLDNIGPLDRDHLPISGTLEQADATTWMALYSLHMTTMALVLDRHGEESMDLMVKFLEHFTMIRHAIDVQGLWDEEDGFYYDRIKMDDGTLIPIKVRSMVGLLPVLASMIVDEPLVRRAQTLGKAFSHMMRREDFDEATLRSKGMIRGEPGEQQLLLSVVDPDTMNRLFARLFDEGEFLSPYGLRSLSKAHQQEPYELDIDGLTAMIDYEPAESTTFMFGGNSNWRGPIWFPLNFLLVSSIRLLGTFFGDSYRVEYPTGSGTTLTLAEVAEDLRRRLISIFTLDEDGRRACLGGGDLWQKNERWQGLVPFNEYFHGDDGFGLGASHQTGWTGVVADLIRRAPGSTIGSSDDLLRPVPTAGRNRGATMSGAKKATKKATKEKKA